MIKILIKQSRVGLGSMKTKVDEKEIGIGRVPKKTRMIFLPLFRDLFEGTTKCGLRKVQYCRLTIGRPFGSL
jgi:hypothetical protein